MSRLIRLPITLFVMMLIFLSHPLHAETRTIAFGMGCFWGAEKRMAALEGVIDVESGFAGGEAETVGYRDVLSLERAIRRGESDGRNHAEVVRVRYDPDIIATEQLLARFWENHDPTQGDRQGNDVGSNYRSAIYVTTDEQQRLAKQTRKIYQQALTAAGYGRITTEVAPLEHYNRAEDYHQNYLEKNPDGYCGLGGTGGGLPRQCCPAEWQPAGAVVC
ncbi:MAG TPA: peptide-methionine (S)-S-oxide reductase MsrA [Guyparkeria sp.]|nr:peptide-methionine (S)-S-oxide reductase MsrA [Guyparkeria sp.]